MKPEERIYKYICENCKGSGEIDIREGETWREHAWQLRKASLAQIKKLIREGRIECPECCGVGEFEKIIYFAVAE